MRVACLVIRDWTETRRRPRMWPACLDALEAFTNVVESVMPGEALVDVTTLEPHYGDGATLARLLAQVVTNVAHAQPSVAIADSPFAAGLAARAARPGDRVVWEAGADVERLAAWPINRLALDPTTRHTLSAAGIITIGDLAALPTTMVTARFGLAARHAQRLILGEAARSVTPRHVMGREGSRQLFPNPVYESFRLRSLASIQARDLRLRLERRGLRPRRVRLTGEMPGGEVRQSSRLLPTVGPPSVLVSAALDEMLAAWPVADGVTALLMILEAAAQAQTDGRGAIVQWRKSAVSGQ